MKLNLTILLLPIIVSSCCSYDRNKFEFSIKERTHFNKYRIGDTIYFQSNFGDVDTIAIIGIDSERYENCNGFSHKPINAKWIMIKHLPVDKWSGTSQIKTNGSQPSINFQWLLSISKYPTDKKTEYQINFKDFHSNPDTIIGIFNKDTLVLNDIKLSNYFKLNKVASEKSAEPQDIETIYWTDKYGLTAYVSKNGEIWTNKRCH